MPKELDFTSSTAGRVRRMSQMILVRPGCYALCTKSALNKLSLPPEGMLCPGQGGACTV